VSQRANLALFLVSLFLIVTPDIAALVTRAAFVEFFARPGADPGMLFDILVALELALGGITHPACGVLASDPLLAGPFCPSFMSLTIALASLSLAIAATIALGAAPRRPRSASDPRPRYEEWIERACGFAVVLFSVPKAYLMGLSYYAPRGAFDGASLVFCGHFFATGPFYAESCALPMTMYLYLSAATLALAVVWWVTYAIAMIRLAFGPEGRG
jgi:hypothetical protein